jgi:hypothetical protein
MLHISETALSNAEIFSSDIRTHLMAIDPNHVGQFSEDGSTTLSHISLCFACRHCHINGTAAEKTDAELIGATDGYHAAP